MSSTLTPEQRSLRARLAAYAMHAQGKTRTGPATEARLRKFETQIDPASQLSPAERRRRALLARRSYMLALSLKASRSHGKKNAVHSGTGTAFMREDASDAPVTAS